MLECCQFKKRARANDLAGKQGHKNVPEKQIEGGCNKIRTEETPRETLTGDRKQGGALWEREVRGKAATKKNPHTKNGGN